jgi:hypothetical protein
MVAGIYHVIHAVRTFHYACQRLKLSGCICTVDISLNVTPAGCYYLTDLSYTVSGCGNRIACTNPAHDEVLGIVYVDLLRIVTIDMRLIAVLTVATGYLGPMITAVYSGGGHVLAHKPVGKLNFADETDPLT